MAIVWWGANKGWGDMAAYINRVFLAGNLTRDPELKTLPGGKSVCSFGLAVRRTPPRDGGEAQTDFFDCDAWGKVGVAIAKHKRKGQNMMVEGRMTQNRWKGSDGKQQSRVVVTVERSHFLDSKTSAPREDAPPPLAEGSEQCPY